MSRKRVPSAKAAVARPKFRSRVERDRKKDDRTDPRDEGDWVIWDEAAKLDDFKEHWPDLPLDNTPGDE